MSYHNQIMNLRAIESELADDSPVAVLAYKTGHRDARHAAAELVGLKADNLADILRRSLLSPMIPTHLFAKVMLAL